MRKAVRVVTERAIDIGQYTFTASDRLMLDTSVWLLIYGPQVPGDNRVAPYSDALRRILEAKSRVYIDLVVLSELINTYARMKHRLVAPKLKFKDFRNTADFQAVTQDIIADVRQVMKQCTWIVNSLALPSVDELLEEYKRSQSDFNDQLIRALCKQHELTLVTDDSDFKDRNMPILTANRQMLLNPSPSTAIFSIPPLTATGPGTPAPRRASPPSRSGRSRSASSARLRRRSVRHRPGAARRRCGPTQPLV